MQGHETMKHLIDVASISTVVATIAGWLPAVAAVFTIIWTLIRIYESKTVQDLINKRKRRK